VTRFLRATLRGWRWAIEHPEEVGALVLKYNPDLDVDIQTDQMLASVPLVHTGEDQIGWMRPEIWVDMYDILIEQGFLGGEFNVQEAYKTEFLEQVYGGEP
jgi:NitT/TauT family transport system substrate-binding protein